MEDIIILLAAVNGLQKQLKTAKLNSITQHILSYEITNLVDKVNRLSDLIKMDNYSNNIRGGFSVIFPEVEKVKELAEQHYIEEDKENESENL